MQLNTAYTQQPTETAPLPLGQAIRKLPGQYSKVLIRPSVHTFAGEMGKGTWGSIWLQLIVLGINSLVLLFISLKAVHHFGKVEA